MYRDGNTRCTLLISCVIDHDIHRKVKVLIGRSWNAIPQESHTDEGNTDETASPILSVNSRNSSSIEVEPRQKWRFDDINLMNHVDKLEYDTFGITWRPAQHEFGSITICVPMVIFVQDEIFKLCRKYWERWLTPYRPSKLRLWQASCLRRCLT